jgi:transcriptional regulator with XRE-family HTH domain
MTFGENLLRLRNENGLTQPKVADGAGISLRAYQNYERGLREPQLSALIALADFYDISLDELVCREW